MVDRKSGPVRQQTSPDDYVDAPAHEPMRAGLKPAQQRSPSTDQKKVRRAMSRGSSLDAEASSTSCPSCGSGSISDLDPDDERGRYNLGHQQCDNCGFTYDPESGREVSRPGRYASVIHRHAAAMLDERYPQNARDWDMAEGRSMTPSPDSVSAQMSDSGTGGSTSDAASGPGASSSAGSSTAMRKGAPFAGYEDFEECEEENSDKRDPAAYCGEIKHRVEDNKKASRMTPRTATQTETSVANSMGQILLRAGESIRLPNGQVINVNDVRRHETSRDHYYIDTDAGTTVVPWSTKFQVVPQGSANTRQEPFPDLGIPGGNDNQLPMNPQNTGASNADPGSSRCPNCGGKGSLVRRGQKYVCSRCGYSETYSGGGGTQYQFSDSGQMLQPTSMRNPNDIRTAVARRAAALLATEGETL